MTVDLQRGFDRNYDEGAYVQQIDYSRDVVPPLTEDDSVWSDALLRARNLP